MFSANRNLGDPNNAEITAEQIEAMLGHQHIEHGNPFGGDHQSDYLFAGNHEALALGQNALSFGGYAEDAARRQAIHDMKSLEEELGGDGDVFFVEETSPLDSTSSTIYGSRHSASIPDNLPSVNDDHSFDETDFEVAVEHLGLEGDFLPETVSGDDVEIATEHLHLAEDVALFGRPTLVDISHERLIDDETLDRLKDEMKRMDQERNQTSLHERSPLDMTSARHLNPHQTHLASLHQSGSIHQNAFASSSAYHISQPTPMLARNDSLRSTNITNGSPSVTSFYDSDASPQSEVSIPQQQKQPRRPLMEERRDSEGSSSSRHLIPLSEETGKRMMIKDRMDQLARLIRSKMRSAWGITEEDPLPGPDKGGPDWSKGSKHPENVKFQEEIATIVFQELMRDPGIAVPENQRTLEAAKVAANVSFNNFGKRYAYQTDERWKAKSARDAKRGRRWARKDLKQKKRLKAASRLEQPIPQQILRMEYMSSEDSSEGEESDLSPGTWQFYADMTGRKSANEKVVEVKTPRWRSTQLQGIYDRLDEIAVTQTAETKGKGYTQVPLRRFKLDALRLKNPPRTAESWMFVDGIRPAALPRKPRRPNDTAKRRAEEALIQHPSEEESSRRKRNGVITNEDRNSHHQGLLETSIETMPPQSSAELVSHSVEDEALQQSFHHDRDFMLFDDGPFDTIEVNEHFSTPDIKCSPQEN